MWNNISLFNSICDMLFITIEYFQQTKNKTDSGSLWDCCSVIVRVLLCVSSVPASCVHIWFVSCPCFMSLWVKYVPAVFVSLCVNYPVYISPVFWVWFRLVYSLLPGVSCPALSCLVLPCPALMSVKTIIWL